MKRSSCSAHALALFVSFAAAACGGAAPMTPTKSPAASEGAAAEDEPRTIEEAQAVIERARAELEGTTHVLETSPQAPATDAPAGEAPPRAEKGAAAPEPACAGSCRALASMRRAVEALCRMTSDTDERCVGARRTLAESTERLAHCRCD